MYSDTWRFVYLAIHCRAEDDKSWKWFVKLFSFTSKRSTTMMSKVMHNYCGYLYIPIVPIIMLTWYYWKWQVGILFKCVCCVSKQWLRIRRDKDLRTKNEIFTIFIYPLCEKRRNSKYFYCSFFSHVKNALRTSFGMCNVEITWNKDYVEDIQQDSTIHVAKVVDILFYLSIVWLLKVAVERVNRASRSSAQVSILIVTTILMTSNVIKDFFSSWQVCTLFSLLITFKW